MFTTPPNALYAPNASRPYPTQSIQTQVQAHQRSSTHSAPHDVYEPSFSGLSSKKDSKKRADQVATEAANMAFKLLKTPPKSAEIQQLIDQGKTPQDIAQAQEDLLLKLVTQFIKRSLLNRTEKEARSRATNALNTARETLRKGKQTMDEVGQSARSQAAFYEKEQQKAKMEKGKKGKNQKVNIEEI